MVMFSTTNSLPNGDEKDTLFNIENQKEFVVNMATYALREEVNLSSASLPRTENEFVFSNLEMEPSTLVKPPRVKNSPIHLECVYYKSIQLPQDSGETNRMVIGKVIGIHIDDDLISNGKIDILKARPIARLGYMDYAIIDNIFSMQRPI